MAEAGTYQVRWSPDVLDEVQRNVARLIKVSSEMPPGKAEKVREEASRYLRETMEHAFPDAMVSRQSYDILVSLMNNEVKDRHVLAAALVGRADVLVTSNVRDFPPESVSRFNIDIQDPDTFLCYQFDLAPKAFLDSLKALANERRPPMNSVDDILEALSKVTPRFVEMATTRIQEERT